MVAQEWMSADQAGPGGPVGQPQSGDAGWIIVGATAQGASHEKTGAPCQDAVAWARSDSGRHLVVALADGGGSAPAAEVGARTAVDSVASSFAARVNAAEAEGVTGEQLVQELFSAARAAVAAAASAGQRPITDLATTLCVVLAYRDELCAAQVGDGLVVARSRTGELAAVARPMRGEYANEVVFLTAGDALPTFEVTTLRLDDTDAFALSSDGLRLLVTKQAATGEPYPPFFEDAFAAAAAGASSQAIGKFLERVDDRTGDDKSLILGIRG
jgi:hypothetical protein